MFQRVAIVTSNQDPAAQTIRKIFLAKWRFTDTGETFDGQPVLRCTDFPKIQDISPGEILLASIKERSIFCEYLDRCNNADLVLFASQHRSETGAPAFLTHCTGNWVDATEHGGRSKEVAYAAGRVLKSALRALFKRNQEAGLQFDVSLEVTHHGPTSNKVPLAFMELGSTEREWPNEAYASVVAQAVMDVAQSVNTMPDAQVYLGFGGPHYAPSFTRIALETPACTSHIVPKYFVRQIGRDQVQQMIERTVEPLAGFLLDWKGLNAEDRAHLLPILNQFNLPVVRTDHLFKDSKNRINAS
jgi:D-aminoacyl-tRNA deacylase